MKGELLWGAQRIKSSLHLKEERTSLEDVLLQNFEVINVAHCMAAMTVIKTAICAMSMQGWACWKGKQKNCVQCSLLSMDSLIWFKSTEIPHKKEPLNA